MPICPQCGREFQPIVGGQMFCAECQAPRFETVEPAPPRRSTKLPATFYLQSPTVWLIAINVVIFLVTCAVSRSLIDINLNTLIRFGAAYGPLTLGGQPWRLLTATFLHGGLMHVAFNMWALLNLGVLAEILFGKRTFTILYFLCGLASSLVSTWWHFHTGSIGVIGVGASGAIFGIAGALLPALAAKTRMARALSGNFVSIVIFVFYSLVSGFAQSHIDNSAHVGGLAAGILLGLILPFSPSITNEHHSGRQASIFAVATIAIVGGFIWMQKSQIAVLDFSRAQSAYQRKDIGGAINYLNKSLQSDPKSPDAHYLMGTILLSQEKNEEATQHLLSATQTVPDWSDAHSELCIAYLRSHKLPEALASCKRAVELDSGNPDKQFNLGLTQRANEDLAGAIDSFTAAEKLRPNGFDEEAMLGESLVDAGRIDEAIVHLRLANKAKPDDRHVRVLLGRLLLHRGDRDEARKLLTN